MTQTDTEQFARLKEAAAAALKNIQGIMDGNDIPSIVVRDMLRVALGSPTGERLEILQCADCLAWINKNDNHTCKPQIRRNRRTR